MMKKHFIYSALMLLCGASLLTTSCKNDEILTEMSQPTGQPFTLVATNGSTNGSRMSLDDDAMTLYWENGDELYLIDTSGKQSPITLTTTLSTPSTTAKFVSEGGVPAGTYIVVNRTDRNNAASTKNYMDYDLYGNRNNGTYGGSGYAARARLSYRSDMGNLLDLYSDPITISNGATNATINLKHVYAELVFDLSNFPAFNNASLSNRVVEIGLMSPTQGFTTTAVMQSSTGTIQQGSDTYSSLKFRSNSMSTNSNNFDGDPLKVNELSALMLPIKMIGTYYVYVVVKSQDYNSAMGSPTATVYEFPITTETNFEAGKLYRFDNAHLLDAATANVLDIPTSAIANEKQFRALAYYHNYGDFYLVDNLDFSNETDCLPLYMDDVYGRYSFNFDGKNKTIKGFRINSTRNNVGLISSYGYRYTNNGNAEPISIKNLVLENIDIKGGDNTGALFGYLDSYGDSYSNRYTQIQNISVTGTSTISGRNNVGGIIGKGYNNGSVSGDVKLLVIENGCTVQGTDYIGGLFGSLYMPLTNCFSSATVSGNSYVGGISGFTYPMMASITKCGSSATVTAKGDYAGGIVGALGYVSGSNDYTFNDALTLSYNIGKVTGDRYVGGITGYSGFSDISNCCSLGDISSTSNNIHKGAIVGYVNYYNDPYNTSSTSGSTKNCYGVIDPNATTANLANSLIGSSNMAGLVNSVTSLPNLGGNDSYISTNVNLKNIFNLNSIYNTDEYYSTSLFWNSAKDVTIPSSLDTYQCPKFKWQEDPLEGNPNAPGFGIGQI